MIIIRYKPKEYLNLKNKADQDSKKVRFYIQRFSFNLDGVQIGEIIVFFLFIRSRDVKQISFFVSNRKKKQILTDHEAAIPTKIKKT